MRRAAGVGTVVSTRSSIASGSSAPPTSPSVASASSRARSGSTSRCGQVGEPRGAAGRAAQPQAQLRDAEDAGEPRPHDVDRLHLREREAQRLPADEAGLDPQVVVLDRASA